jgi:hypothetical protein
MSQQQQQQQQQQYCLHHQLPDRRHCLKSGISSPLSSPAYVKSGTPYSQKARKEISYRTVHCFDDDGDDDDDDSGSESDDESDESDDDDIDCEQIAAFLVDFLGEDEDCFDD